MLVPEGDQGELNCVSVIQWLCLCFSDSVDVFEFSDSLAVLEFL